MSHLVGIHEVTRKIFADGDFGRVDVLDLSDCQLEDECLIRLVPVFGHVGRSEAVSGPALDTVELPAAGPRAEGGGGRGHPQSVNQLALRASASLCLCRVKVNLLDLLGREVRLATVVHPNVLE